MSILKLYEIMTNHPTALSFAYPAVLIHTLLDNYNKTTRTRMHNKSPL